jgi:hypothetical protein
MILQYVSYGHAHSLADSGGPRPRALGLAHAIDAVLGVRLGDGGSGRRGRFDVLEASEGLSLGLVGSI